MFSKALTLERLRRKFHLWKSAQNAVHQARCANALMFNIKISACLRSPSRHLSDTIITLVTGSGSGLPRLLRFLCWECDGRRFLALLFTLQTRPKLVAFPAVVQKRVIKTHWAACGAAATSTRQAAELKEAPSNSQHLYKSGDSELSELVVFSPLVVHQHRRRGTTWQLPLQDVLPIEETQKWRGWKLTGKIVDKRMKMELKAVREEKLWFHSVLLPPSPQLCQTFEHRRFTTTTTTNPESLKYIIKTLFQPSFKNKRKKKSFKNSENPLKIEKTII